MGGRGTFAAGKQVEFKYETVGYVEGVKILEPINKKVGRRLPEEAHSSQEYVKLDYDGHFYQYRRYDEGHNLVFEIGYHSEARLTNDKINGPVFHAHDYYPDKYGDDWRSDARNLTLEEFDAYKKFFVNIPADVIAQQRERLL